MKYDPVETQPREAGTQTEFMGISRYSMGCVPPNAAYAINVFVEKRYFNRTKLAKSDRHQRGLRSQRASLAGADVQHCQMPFVSVTFPENLAIEREMDIPGEMGKFQS